MSLSYLERSKRFFRTSHSPFVTKIWGRDYVWALCVDSILRETRALLQHNRFASFKALEAFVRDQYRQVKLENEVRLLDAFLDTLNETDRELYDYFSNRSFEVVECSLEEVHAILKAHNEMPSRVIASDTPLELGLGEIVHSFLDARLQHELDAFGVTGFCIPRTEEDGYENVVCTLARETHGHLWAGNFVGRLYEDYLPALDAPELRSRWRVLTPLEANEEAPQLAGYLSCYPALEIACWEKFPANLTLTKPLMTTYALRLPQPETTQTLAAVWVASSPVNVPEVFRQLESCFQRHRALRRPPFRRRLQKALLDNVAEFQWFYQQLMPYQRGSSIVGEIIARAMLESAGFEPGVLRQGALLDLQAFCMDLEPYQASYAGLFESL
jgi:hypothetical protein